MKIGSVSQILSFGVLSLQGAIVDYIGDFSCVSFAQGIHTSQLFSVEPLSVPLSYRPFGNVWRYFWWSQLGALLPVASTVAARDAATSHISHRTDPPRMKNYLVQNVSGVKVEKT